MSDKPHPTYVLVTLLVPSRGITLTVVVVVVIYLIVENCYKHFACDFIILFFLIDISIDAMKGK
jgi:hypothetical protein